MIKVQDLKKTTNRLLFEGLSFQAESGLVKVDGNSGCGKSTLFAILMGLDKPDSGLVDLRGLSFSYMGEKNNLLLDFSLLKNMEIFSLSQQEKEEANRLSEKLNFNHLLDKKLNTLSGGELKKAELIFALSKKTSIYFLDECYSFLDEKSRKMVDQIISMKQKDSLIFLIDHEHRSSLKENLLIIIEEKPVVIVKEQQSFKLNKITNEKKKKRTRIFFSLLKSYLSFNKAALCFSSVLFLLFSLFFSLGLSFANTNSVYQNGRISVENDPFYSHDYVSSSQNPITEETMLQSSLSLILKSEKQEKFLFIENNRYSLKSLKQERDIKLNDSEYQIEVLSESEILDVRKDAPYTLTSFIDGVNYDVDEVIFIQREMMKEILQHRAENILINENKMLSLPSLIQQGDYLKISDNNTSFSITDEEKYTLHLPSEIKNIQIKDATGQNVIEMMPSIPSDCFSISYLSYADFLIHYSVYLQENYLTITIPQESYLKMRDNSILVLHSIASPSQVGHHMSFLYFSLSIFSFFLLILFIILTSKATVKWYINCKNTLCVNSVNINILRRSINSFHFLRYLFIFLVTLFIYLFGFLPYVNLSNTEQFYHPMDGYFYYSMQPMNSYFDSIHSIVNFNQFNFLYLLSIALIFLLISFEGMIYALRIKRRRK